MRTLLKNKRGQGLVEFALIVPILLFLFLGMVNLGLAISKLHTLNQIAKDMAREASAGESQGELRDRAQNMAELLFPVIGGSVTDATTASEITITGRNGDTVSIVFRPGLSGRIKGEQIAVEVAYDYPLFLSLNNGLFDQYGTPIPDTIPLRSKAYSRMENRNTP